jgi:lipid-A-disaccharide synthase
MKPPLYMVVAGETSGDTLAAELVGALRQEYARRLSGTTPGHQPLQTGLAPRFFGAGGPRMAAAGVHLEIDMTAHAVIGLAEALKKLLDFRRLFHQLLAAATQQTPDALLCVDFSGFNRRFAHAVRRRAGKGVFRDWNPKIIQFVSPQVWASRPGRARLMAEDFNLLLSIFPFEPGWYAQHAPKLKVVYVGHPIVDRHLHAPVSKAESTSAPHVVLLPGSRTGELKRHLPVVYDAAQLIRVRKPATRFTLVLPDSKLAAQARAAGLPSFIDLRIGELSQTLATADLAIASTGTVTLECAWFRVPTIALYKTSWSTYQIAKRIITVKYLAMPNLLADAPVFPEFIQNDADGEKIGAAASDLLENKARRQEIRRDLDRIANSLGEPGAVRRAAEAILTLQGY